MLATGAHWSADGLSPVTHEPLPGADASLGHVFTPEQLMVERQAAARIGTYVVVYDCEGYFMGAGLAELLRTGRVLGRHRHAVSAGGRPLRQHRRGVRHADAAARGRRRLHRNVAPSHAEGRIEGHGEFGVPFARRGRRVVLVTHRFPDNQLYQELVAATGARDRLELYQVGDCVSPRMLADTVFDGHRLAREIDSDDPAHALPYLRERPLIPV